ncbi:MAG: hypothetical protein CSB21_03410 [Deltaproteobacteria bacterium]|nr:MAG: hypothetical protein CSB21_03410 [Deltaproteobacteria bacterium]
MVKKILHQKNIKNFNLQNFLFLNTLALFCLFFTYSSMLPNSSNMASMFFFIISALGHAFSIVLITWPFFYILKKIIKKNKFFIPFPVLFFSCLLFFMAINYKVFLQYRFHINMEIINLFFVGGKDIFSFQFSEYLYASVLFLVMFFAEILFALKINFYSRFSKFVKIIIFFFLFLSIISSHLIHALADAKNSRYITTASRQLPYFYPLTAKRFLEKHKIVRVEQRDIANINKKFHSQLQYPPSNLRFKKQSPSQNILIILVDCLRYDMTRENIMPTVNQFSKKRNSLYFKNHLSGGNGTRIGTFSLFYGLIGTYWDPVEDESISPLLMDTLISQNYETAVFASATLKAPPFNRTIFNKIKNLRVKSDGDTAYERDIDITNDFLAWLENYNGGNPFFGFLFYDSAHAFSFPENFKIKPEFKPYLDKVEYHKLNSKYNPVPFRNRYKISLNFIDSLIGEVLKSMDKKGLLENTVIIITGDHGQEFNESGHNFWGHGGNFTDYQIKVPLIVHWPGKEKKEYFHLTSHTDIAPTLLQEVFGCTNKASEISNGRNLFNDEKRKWVFSGGFSKKAIIQRDRINVTFQTGHHEIFDRNFDILENAKPRPDIYKEVFIEQSRFYKK